MPLDWNAPLQTKHDRPRYARLMDGIGAGGRRRVAITGDFALLTDPKGTKSLAMGAFDGDNGNQGWPTVFLFDESGRCNTGGADSPFDLVNTAAA